MQLPCLQVERTVHAVQRPGIIIKLLGRHGEWRLVFRHIQHGVHLPTALRASRVAEVGIGEPGVQRPGNRLHLILDEINNTAAGVILGIGYPIRHILAESMIENVFMPLAEFIFETIGGWRGVLVILGIYIFLSWVFEKMKEAKATPSSTAEANRPG